MGNNLKKPELVDMDLIAPNLYLGSIQPASSLKALQTANISHIVNLCGDNYFPEHFVYKKIGIPDNPVACIGIHFDHALDFIEAAMKENGVVLIHCAAGVSRSSAITIAYLMRKRKWGYYKTFDYVKNRRIYVNPNPSFETQLVYFESCNCKRDIDWSNMMKQVFWNFKKDDVVECWIKPQWISGHFVKYVDNLFFDVQLCTMKEGSEPHSTSMGNARKPFPTSVHTTRNLQTFETFHNEVT